MSSNDLTSGEIEILIDGLSDDVALVWVLIHLGIQGNPEPRLDWRPSEADVAAALASLKKLVDAELMRVGRMEYIDGGPPGRLSPVKHVPEPFAEVARRVAEAVRDGDWDYACWAVNTERGDATARQALDERLLTPAVEWT